MAEEYVRNPQLDDHVSLGPLLRLKQRVTALLRESEGEARDRNQRVLGEGKTLAYRTCLIEITTALEDAGKANVDRILHARGCNHG